MRAALAFVSIAAGVAALLTPGRAGAVETGADVETDHVSAIDDGGPRRVGILVNPLPASIGWVGGEVDAAIGERVAVTVEGDTRVSGITGYAASVGAALFTQGLVFRGWYLHPSAEWAHEAAAGVSATGVGGSVRTGYEWTALAGATLRLGAGVSYARETVSGAAVRVDLGGLRPLVDLELGWVF